MKQNLKICSTSCQRLLITSGSVYYQVHINITHNLSSRLQEEAYLRIPESGIPNCSNLQRNFNDDENVAMMINWPYEIYDDN